MENVNNRIRKIREVYFDDSNKDFAVAVKKNPNSTSNWLKDGYPVGKKVYEAIQDALPQLSMAWLLTGEGAMETKPIEENAIFRENDNTYLIPLVSQYAYAGYLCGFADENYMETLPKVPVMAERERKGEYLCFEVRGDSMEENSRHGIFEGDRLICRKIQQSLWSSKLHLRDWDFVIVHKTEGILAKRVLEHNTETGDITIHSLNPAYEDRVINIADVAQLFNIVEVHRGGRR